MIGNVEVTLQATQEGAQPRMVMGLLREGQTSVTVTFARLSALTAGDWVLSLLSAEPPILLGTDANSSLAVTIGPPLPRLTLSVDQGVPSGDLRLVRISTASGTSRSLEGLAVSPDGRWLFNAGSNLEVWEIDSARGIVTQSTTSTKTGSSRGLAVSPDSRFVFVPDNVNGTITAFRLDADDGRLEEVETYTEGGRDAAENEISGLTDVWDVVPSPNSRLLFITSGGESETAGGALSVWRVNPSGTLVQTDVHLSAGASNTEGLNRAAGAAVTPDGRLLFVGAEAPGSGTLSIWRVNAEASTVSHVRNLFDSQRLTRPRAIALPPSGHLLFAMNYQTNDYLSVYSVNAAQEGLTSVAPVLMGRFLDDITATEEALIASDNNAAQISLLRINENDTVSPVSRQDAGDSLYGVVASPAGGLVFSNSADGRFITVWQVLGIPRVTAGQEVRVIVNAEPAPDSLLTMIVQARQGSRISTAAATLRPPNTQAEAVFSGSALGQGEWVFSVSVLTDADTENIVDVLAARATLRIGIPFIRISNLSGVIPEGADLNIRVSVEGNPVREDAEVTLRAIREGAQPRTVMGVITEGQTSVTVTFADENALTQGVWIVSAETSSTLLQTDANSTLAVTVGPLPPKLTLSVDQGVPSGDLRLVRRSTASGTSISRQGLAVSPDGRWLFNAGNNLEVWEIDIARGIVMQRMSAPKPGLSRGLAVSRDSSLVFVPDNENNQITVWRLNADNGRLAEVETYTEGGQDSAGDTVRGLINVWDVVPSPDGRLLFVTSGGGVSFGNSPGGALSVWSINSTSTLTQTDVHISAGASDTEGLNQAAGAAVTPDGRLLFVGSYYENQLDQSTLSIWRVNAEAATVSFVRTLRDPQRLRQPRTIALPPSGRLLFVMNYRSINHLSVYRVNAAQENLVSVGPGLSGDPLLEDIAATEEVLIASNFSLARISLLRINENDTVSPVSRQDAEDALHGVVASPAGSLVFSNSNDGRFITVWQVQGIPRVPAGQDVRVMVNAERAPGSALTVMVWARQGSRVSMAAATLGPRDTRADAMFSGSALGQGEWMFSASVPADMENLADASAARATLRIDGPQIRLSNLSGLLPAGADLDIRVSTEGTPVLQDTEVTLQATREGAQPRTVMGLLQEEQTSVTVTFAGENALTEGDWILSAEPSILFRTDANSTLAVTVGPPLLIRLSNLSGVIQQGADLNIRVSVEGPVLRDAEVTLRAAQEGAQPRTVMGIITGGQTSVTVTFAGENALTEGDWILSAEPSLLFRTDVNSTLAVTVRPPPLIRLSNLSGAILQGADLNIRVSAEGPPVLRDAEVTLRAAREGTQSRTVMGIIAGGQTSVTVTFAGENALTEGDWILSAEPSILLGTDADSTLAVTVGPPLPRLTLSLQETAEPVVPAGSALGITVMADRPLVQDLTVTVQAVRTAAAPATVVTAAVTIRLLAAEQMGNALFEGENALPPGQWVLTIAEFIPEDSAEASTQQLQVRVGSSALGLSAPMGLFQGQDAVIEVNTEVALGVEVRVMVMATHASTPTTTASAAAVLEPSALAAEARFPANMLSLVREGTWNFEITAATPSVLMTDTETFPLVDFREASATLQVTEEPTLLLELPPQPVDPAQPVSIRLQKSTTISEELTVDITAMRPFGGMTLTSTAMATLSPSDTTAAAVFGPGELSAGRWTLTASVRPPETVPIFPPTVTMTVRPPLLRLQRLGPASVAAGTRVTVRVEAEAMPEDEGLGVRVIARQAMRADRERSAVLGSQSDFSADVEFTSLPPGEWLLTAEAERPDAFRTEGARDTVTVEPAVLTLTPVLERVPAGESARLILGSVVPLGVAVRINVVAEPVSPSFSRQMTAVNLDAASTSAMVVYDPGELAPGIWNFNVQVMDAAVRMVANVSMATATLRVAAPLIRLANLSGEILQGADLNIRVSTEGMIPVAGDAEVTLRAMLQEGTQQRIVTGRLLEGQTSVTVTFAGEEALTGGDWTVSAETASTLLQTDVNISSLTVRVFLPPLKLTLSVDQGVPSGELRLVRLSVASESSSSEDGFAVSPDGRWLINAGRNLELWEIDSVRGIVTQRMSSPQSDSSRGLAVSPDSRFVFVTDKASTGTITVWRLNADDGTLAEVAQYTEGGEDAARNTVRGLTSVWDAVLSPDGRLLFVTSRGVSDTAGGALSVWSVNPSGTLVQTDVHLSAGALDTEGLNRAAGAAVTPDGRLLFVASFYGFRSLDSSTLGIWRVNAETSSVSFVRILSDRQRLARPRSIAFAPSGRLLFVSNQVRVEAATGTLSVYRVNAEEEDLASLASYGGDSFVDGNAAGLAATREVLAVTESRDGVSLWQRNDEGTLRFVSRHAAVTPIGVAASPAGGLIFSSSFDESAGISVWLVQGIPRVLAGQEVRVMVSAEPAPGSALTVMVQARQGSRVRTAAAMLMPPAAQADAVFSGSDLGYGEWIFSASVPADRADRVDRTALSAARATLRIGGPPIRISNLSGEILQGADLNIRVSTEGMVPVTGDAEVTLRAMLQEGAQQRAVMGILLEGQTSVTVTFAGENALTGGDWVLSAESPILQTGANSTLAVTVIPLPLLTLSLQETAEPVVPAGSALGITVMADRPLMQDLTVTVQAVRTVTAPPTVTTATVTTQLFAGEEMGNALFEGENALPPGQWVLTIAELIPEDSAEASPQELQVRVGPSALGLSAPMDLLQGQEAVIEVDTEVALGVEVRVIVMATHASAPAITASAAAVLEPSALAAEARFPANMLSLVREGTWNFEITAATPSVLITDTEAFPLVDFTGTTATLQVTVPREPTLLLELPPQPVDPAQPVSIRLQKSAPISEMLTVDITAMRPFGGMTLTRMATAMLSPSDTTAAAVFGPGALSAGRWTLTASVRPPGTVPIIPPTATMTVRPPLLRLQRLGPASVAAGTPVAVRVEAEAMPEDEGLGVRVIARQAMRADRERSAVLGSQSNFSADVEFTSLPPGEWMLTAEAERPDAFRTENARDTVTVEPAVLTLTPVLERVPAGEPARLILGSAVPLGVAVSANVVAEPVSPSFSRQMTAVNLDAASTSTTVVYDPGELAPGIWNFNVQVIDAAVRMVADVSMATATLRIAAPLIRLANLSGEILQGAELNIRVSTEGMVPVAGDAEVTLRATLQEGTQQRTVTGRLLEGQTSVTVTFADENALTEGDWTVSAETASTLLQTDANLSSLTVIVGPPPRLLLGLTGGSGIVDSDGMITLILRLMPALPAAVTVTVTVTDEDNNMISEQQVEVALSSSLQLTFSASDLGTGRLRFTARGPAGVLEDSGAEVTVQVRARSTVELTLDASARVTVGGSFMVAVGASEATPIPAETPVMVTVSFGGAERTAVLTDTTPTTSVSVVAPVASGEFLLVLSGSAEATTVLGASTQISVVPVQLTLSLEGPESVQVGEDFMVTVGTGDDAVPAGTTVLVTVSDGVTDAEVMLAARISTASVSFTAPIRAGEVSVTAAGVPQTSSGSLEVAVSDASPLAVTASGVDVQLSLSGVPENAVVAGSTFTITVGVSEETPVPAGTTAVVTLSFGNTFESMVRLTREASARSVIVDAPDTGGTRELRAAGVDAGDGAFDLNVLPAAATVQVQGDVPLLLVLLAPEAVQAGSTFDVDVSTDLPVPAEATVTVTVGFDGAEREVVLTAAVASVTTSFTAPARLEPGGLPVTATAAVDMADPDILQVIVDTAAVVQVRVEALSVQLTLSEPDPNPVDGGQSFRVTVGVLPALLANTTVAAVVTFNGSTAPATLSDREPESTVSFTALAVGLLEVTAEAVAVEPAGLVAVSDAVAQSVRVRPIENTVRLTLDAPASVTVDSSFTVAVGASEATPIPAETTVMVTVRFAGGQRMAVLTDRAPTTSVSFVAPVVAGSLVLLLSGSAEAANALRMVTVISASRSIEVVPVQLTLSLEGPEEVQVGEAFSVIVGTGDDAVPAGTTILVTVSDGVTDGQAMLTAATPTASVSFTAPIRMGEVRVTAAGIPQTSLGSLEVTVSDASSLAVTASRVDVQLSLGVPENPVAQREDFTITVGVSDATPVPTGITVVVTVTLGNQDVGAAELTREASTTTLTVNARGAVGARELRVTGMAVGRMLDLNVLPAAATVRVRGSETLFLQMIAPEMVEAGSTFDVDVSTDIRVPPGATVTVTVSFEGTEREAVLTAARLNVLVSFTAPARLAPDGLLVTPVTATVEVADPDVLQLIVDIRNIQTVIVGALSAQLTLSEPTPNPVDAGQSFTVTVGLSPALLAGTTVTAEVTFNGSTIQVTLSDRDPESMVTFTAPTAPGSGILDVTAAAVAVEPAGLVEVADAAAQSVRVRTMFMVELTLDAPASVTVGGSFMVAVGASEATPVPAEAPVMVTVSFGGAERTAVLTDTVPTMSVSFVAPTASGEFLLVLSGSAEATTVLGASAQIAVVPVQLVLSLEGPGSVQVGDAFSVTAGTGDDAVPTGTTILVTVSDGVTDGQAMLTARIPTASVSFTAPIRAGEVSVTATGVSQMSSGSLEVAVSDASPLTVTAFRVDVQLSLSGVPEGPISTGSTFTITVGVSDVTPVPAGITVLVTVSFGDTFESMVRLTREASARSVIVDVPDTEGARALRADGVGAGDGALDLNVLPAAATVQVRNEVDLFLMLTAPEAVPAGSAFDVNVSTDLPVPAEAMVTVTVGFDGAEREVVLTAAVASVITSFTAPARLEPGGLPVTATAVVDVADLDILQVDVDTAAVAQVRVEALSVQLTLSEPDPNPVDAGQNFTVAVGVSPALLANTTVTVEVTFNGSAIQVMLSDRDSESMVTFTAPASGILDVTAAVAAVEPVGLVEVAAAAAQSVRVRAMSTVELTLDASASVTVGGSFMVTVGVSDTTPVPAETTVTVTVSFEGAEREVMLTDTVPTMSVSFAAPVVSGEFSLVLSGSAETLDPLRMVTVLGASAQIAVVPIQLTLSLEGPESVQVGEAFSVTVGTGDDAVPAGTIVTVTVSDGATDAEAMLTAAIPTASVSFTAPIRAGEVSVTATGVSQTSAGSLEVAVSNASALAVTASPLQAMLTLSAPSSLVSANSLFEVIVGISPALSAGASVEVAVTFGTASQRVMLTDTTATVALEFMAPAMGGAVELTAESVDTGGTLELNVESAMATVQVQEQVSLKLMLREFDAIARERFEVVVSTDMSVPAETTVMVTVSFEGAEREVMLTSAAAEVTVRFTAPARLAGNPGLPLTAVASSVETADADILVVVEDADVAGVRVFTRVIRLTLSEPNPSTVDAGESFTVTVGAPPGQLTDTTITAAVTFNESTRQVTLSEREPESMVSFTAPALETMTTLDVTAVPVAVEPAVIVMVFSAFAQITVRVFLPPLKLTLSVDQGVPSGELRLVRLSVASESSSSEDGFAVSPDGRWLINAGSNLELWEIDSVRGIVTQRMSSPQSGSSRGLAVSPDSRLVFVTDKASTGTITVWRLNADEGTLAEVAQYTEGGEDAAGNTVRGLTSVWDAVLSPDGRLLFVTSRGESETAGGALSVWSVNPSGTLVQTDVHLSAGALDTEGLNRAAGAAVTPDGRLLFVASFYGFRSLDSSTLGIWRVNAETSSVSFVRILSDRQRLARPRNIAFAPSGRLLFVSNQVGVNAATGTLSVYRVNSAEENLANLASYGEDSFLSGLAIGLAATREVLAVTESRDGVSLWQRNDDGTLRFASRHAAVIPIGVAASPAGGLIFSSSFDESAGISVWQVQGIPRVLAGQEVRVMVDAERTPGSALTVMVQARQGSLVRTAEAMLMPPAAQADAVFSGSDLGYGEWIFSASVPADRADRVDRTALSAARATLRIGGPPIRISNLSGEILQGADLNIRVSTEGMVPVTGDAEVTLRAMLQESTQQRAVTGILLEGQTSVTVTFAGENALTGGDWVLSAESPILQTGANSTLAVTVIPLPLLTLSLQETAEPVVPAGSTLGITVMADRPLMQDLTVTVQAVRTATAPATVTIATVTTRLFAAEQMGSALFEGENALPPGQWVLTIAELIPEDSAEVSTSTQQLQVRVGPSALGLSAPMDLLQGQEAVIEVNTEVALGVEVRVIVMATHASAPTITASAAAVLEPSALAAEARFPANMLSLVREGTWNFEITAATPSVLITDTGEFPLVDFTEASATLQVTVPVEPTLFLELPPQPVDPAQPVSIRLQKSAPISERLTVDITAMRLFGEMTLTRMATAMLSSSDTTAAAVFGPGALSAGRWTLTASVRPPGTVPIIPPTATMTVRPPLLRLQRLGPASVAAGTPVAVRVEAEAMPEDEGLGVRVIARQAMRADVERSAVLGSQSDFSADVEFTSLSPGEWLLTAEAERPDAFRTEGATDTVTVEPAVLTLTPVLERVPAGEPARLILGSVVPLGVAVRINVVAEPVSPSFSRQMTAVNLDAASTSTTVVYDPGELAPGIWNFNVQVIDAAVRMVADVSMATATLRIAAPLIRLANLSGEILQGAELNIRVSTEGMVPVAGDAEVTLRATLQEGTQQRTVTGRLLEGQTSVTVTFADENALTEGDWTVSAETASTLLQTDANLSSLTVIVGPPPRLLLELTGGSAIVASDSTITLILRLMPALSSTVTVTVTVTDEDSNTISEQQAALSSSLQLTFRASDLGTGRRLFTARGPAGVLEDSGAEVTVLVGTVVSAVLSANPEEDVFPGDEVLLSAAVFSGSDPVGISIILEAAVTLPDGSTRSNVLIPVSAETSTGGLTFIPDAVSGAWTFNVIESDGISAPALTVVVTEVMLLDFNDPLDGVNADDLVLLLRYERLCAAGDSRPLPADCPAPGSEAPLATGLAFESSSYRLADLQNVRLPDVTGTGIGSVQTLTILLQALANIQDELLLPAAASSLPETTTAEAEQARDARLRIIRQLLGRE